MTVKNPVKANIQSMAKLISGLSYKHSAHQIFSDFIEMGAISISNAVDKPQYEAREARYMEIIKRYKREEIDVFPQLLGELGMTLEDGPDDVLGKLFHELELHNTYKGQFFTPYELCKMMAMMTLCDDHRETIRDRGFITASEPACGGGAMIIALAEAMKGEGINYQQALHVTAVDLDIRCVHMAYLQFSLLHIPAVIVHGNTLSLEEFGHWYTPAHIMGGWNWKLRRTDAPKASALMQAFEGNQPEAQAQSQFKQDSHPAGNQYVKPKQLTLF